MNYLLGIGLLVLAMFILWLWAIAPKISGRPDLSEFNKYDYAHRGLHNKEQKVPENSLKAFRLAANAGFGMEFDLQLTKDSKVVVHHDADLKRSCGADVKIADLTLEEVRAYKIFDTDERIPVLEEVLQAVGRRVPLIIELKNYNDPEILCTVVWDILRHYKGLYCVESFDPRIVKWFHDNQPQVVRGQLMEKLKKGENNLSAPAAFFGRNLFTNFLTRPNFEAYDFNNRNNLSLWVAKKLFGMQEVSWTIRNWDDYNKAKKDGCIVIFEGFEPFAKAQDVKNEEAVKVNNGAATVHTVKTQQTKG